jgi:Tfp pilus assembly protein PilN/Tfp pilus assembly PilM family ATPase
MDVHSDRLRHVELIRGFRGFRIGSFGEIELTTTDAAIQPSIRESMSQSVRDLSRTGRIRSKRVVMGLSRGRYFFRKITLPPVPGEKLEPIIRNQAERTFPIRGDQLVYDYQEIGKGKNGGREVILVGARSADIEEMISISENIGLDLLRIDMRESSLCNLLRHPERAAGDPLILLNVDDKAVFIELLAGGRLLASRGATLNGTEPAPEAVIGEVVRTMSFYNELTGEDKGIDRIVVMGETSRLESVLPELERLSGGRVERLSREHVGLDLPDGFKLETHAHALGLALSGFQEGTHTIDLLPQRIKGKRLRDEWIRTGVISIALLFLLFSFSVVSMRRDEARYEAIQREIAEIEGRVNAARELKLDYENLVNRIQTMNKLQNDIPHWLVLLDHLSRAVPEDAWLTALDMEQGESLRISGHAASAARLIPRLESSPYFKNVKFEAPTTKRDFGGEEVETFRITAEIQWMAEKHDQAEP